MVVCTVVTLITFVYISQDTVAEYLGILLWKKSYLISKVYTFSGYHFWGDSVD